MTLPPPRSTLFPYTTLFRSEFKDALISADALDRRGQLHTVTPPEMGLSYRHSEVDPDWIFVKARRSEEHTSELQSHVNLVCRLLLEKKKQNTKQLKLSHQPT